MINTAFAYNTGDAGYIRSSFKSDEREQTAHGKGEYVSKAYNPEIAESYKANGITLQRIGNRFDLYMDDDKLNSFFDRKTAETMFMDFADLTPAKFKKMKAAQA